MPTTVVLYTRDLRVRDNPALYDACRRGGGAGYRVVTPYRRRWSAAPLRTEAPIPGRIRMPPGLIPGELPDVAGDRSRSVAIGGETAGLRRLEAWRGHAAERFDPGGEYVRPWVPEFAAIAGPAVHRPWGIAPGVRRRTACPAPLVPIEAP